MSCFHLYKEKARSKEHKTAPIGKKKNKSGVQEDNRVTRSSGEATTSRNMPGIYEEKAQNLRVFTYAEMSKATGNFQKMLKIGEGGFGCVYKGTIEENGQRLVVAIKKLNTSGYQGHRQWITEVQFLGVVDHPNLVKLIGYCAVDGERGIQRLLVYEYMYNKSLEDHLFNDSKPVLSWDQRLQIMLGAAQGLAYLHEELEIQVIYRDFKSSNVLLDKEFKPKLSDFGLAREGPEADHTHVSTAVVGTFGYAAPDYVKTGHLNSKSDVWSFGVVLYEILTGRRSMERNLPKSQQKLLDWVKQYPADSKKFSKIIDPRLQNQYSLTAARKISKLAASCLVKSPKDRPKMSQVVETLKHIVEISRTDTSPTELAENEIEEEPIPVEQMGAPDSARRRIAHLAQISQHVEGADIGRFMMMHRIVRSDAQGAPHLSV